MNIQCPRFRLQAVWIISLLLAGQALAEEAEGKMRLTLTDGTVVNGKILAESIQVETSFGTVTIPIRTLAGMDFQSKAKPNALAMPGGDKREVLHYDFAEDTGRTVKDISGNGRDGTTHKSMWTPNGRFSGGAMYFNGQHGDAGSWIAVRDAPDFPAWETYSVSVWFMHDGGESPEYSYGCRLIDKTSMMHDWSISLNPRPGPVGGPGAISLWLYESDQKVQLIDHSKDYRDNQWHHVVVLRNGKDGQFWVDGALKDSAGNMMPVYNKSGLCIGNSFSSDSHVRGSWSGEIDEVRIFNAALSPDEIKTLYTGNALNE